MTRGLTRRTVLVAGLAVLGWLRGVPSWKGFRGDLPGARRALASYEVVGLAYLALRPEERSVVTLRDFLRDVWPTAGAAPRDPFERLRARIRRDFETGDVLSVHGWILSRTELRFAALRALEPGAWG